jgi:hypothetical protein
MLFQHQVGTYHPYIVDHYKMSTLVHNLSNLFQFPSLNMYRKLSFNYLHLGLNAFWNNYEANVVVIDLRCHIFIIKVQHYEVNQHLESLFSFFSYKQNLVWASTKH